MSTMNIQDLFDHFNSQISVGNLQISMNDSLYNDFPLELQQLIARIPGESVVIQVGNNGLTLTGNNKLTIAGDCPDTTIWPLEGLEKPKIKNIHLTIVIEADTVSSFTVTSHATANLLIGSKTTGIVLEYQQDKEEHPWQLTLPTTGNASLSPTDMISLGFNYGIPFDIPTSITFLDTGMTVDKEQFSVLFYPNTEYGSFTQFVVKTTNLVWNPIPGIFSFTGLDVCGLLKPNFFSLTFIGHIVIGSSPNQVSIDVGIGVTTTDTWLVYLRPTPPQDRFPGLAALVSWIGHQALTADINTGFSGIGVNYSLSNFDLAISYVDAYINVYEGRLQTLNIGNIITIGTTNGTISQALELDINLGIDIDPGPPISVGITLDGSLHDGIPLKIKKFLASFPSIAESASIIPENLEIAAADFHADLKAKNYSLSLELNNVWSFESFSLDNILFYLEYQNQGFQGSLACGFSITEATRMRLSAEYGGSASGWKFSGGIMAGSTLMIGDILTLLGEKFGLTSVPEPLKTLQLTEFEMSFETGSKRFEFVCTGNFKVDEAEDAPLVEMSVGILVEKPDQAPEGSVQGSNGWHATFSGRLTINNLNFNIVFDTQNRTRNIFIATYHQGGNKENIPLHDLVAGVSDNLAQFIPDNLILDLQEVKFVFYQYPDPQNPQASKKQFLFGLQFGVDINLKDLPVIGDKLPEDPGISIQDMQLVFTSALFTQEQVSIVNPLLPEGIILFPAEGLPKGLLISGELNILGVLISIDTGKKVQNPGSQLAPARYSQSFIAATDLTGEESVSPSEITWFNVQKKIGPLEFRRLGFAYEDNTVSFALDASLMLGPATLSMTGLSITTPLSEFDPSFGLQGFGMSIKKSGLEIGGAFLNAGNQNYYGMVLVRMGNFGLKALGGHIAARPDPANPGKTIPASFFIYANVEIPLGGPPCFYLTGFAGGFGINNRLLLPTIENLPDYILLPGKAPEQGASPEDTITAILPQMQQYFVSEPGQYWMAAGISFSSFQMINAFAVATVSFGVDLQIALIGSCSMTFPKGAATPIAYLEITLMASYSPNTGLVAVAGMVAPASYLFGDFCRISGGFAFYLWINPPALPGGPRNGEFLVSLGGYHPDFNIPSYYPKLPRIGLNFNLPPLQITGEAYFTITPAVMMAGGKLQALWESGSVKALLKFGVDFSMAWAPFQYHAAAYANVLAEVWGAKFNTGVMLEIWGPPFSGKACFKVAGITIEIRFGNRTKVTPSLLTWDEFKTQFLPAGTPDSGGVGASQTNILKASVPVGLQQSDTGGLDWVIDSDNFIIQLSTSIPASHLKRKKANNESEDLLSLNKINIKPMGKNDIGSVFTVSLSREIANGSYQNITSPDYQPVLEDSAGALWGRYEGHTDVNASAFLPSTLTGVRIAPVPRIPSGIHIAMMQLMLQEGEEYHIRFDNWSVERYPEVSFEIYDTVLTIFIDGERQLPANENYILNSVDTIESAKWHRGYILQEMFNAGLDVYTEEEINLQRFATETAMEDWPGIAKLGDRLSTNI